MDHPPAGTEGARASSAPTATTADARHAASPPARPWHPSTLAVLLVCAATIVMTSGLVYSLAREWAAGSVNAKLEAVGQLKATEISRWVEQRSDNVRRMLGAPLFSDALRQWLDSGRSPGAQQQRLVGHLGALAQIFRAPVADLYSVPDGALILNATGEPPVTLDAGLAARAGQERRILFDDFHLERGNAVRLGFFIPVGRDRAGAPLATLHLEFDPSPIWQSWLQRSTRGKSSEETLLARREGDEVTFMEPAPAGTGPERARSFSIASGIPAARGVTGQRGLVSGRDYRGEPVLAYLAPIAGTPWILVSKIDQSEAYAYARLVAMATAAAAGLLLAAAWWWWARREREAAARHADELARVTLARRIDDLGRRANDGILLCDDRMRLIEANDRCLAIYGYSRGELLGKDLNDLRAQQAQIDLSQFVEDLARVPNGLIYETLHRRKDGTVFPVEASVCLLDVGDARICQAVIRDVSERKRAEEERMRQAHRLAELSRNLMSVQEEERRELALELHDVASPNLAAIRLNLQLALTEAGPAMGEEAHARFEDCTALLEDTTRSLRAICANLRPPGLDYGGLLAALESYAHQIGGSESRLVRVRAPAAGWARLPREDETILFRIAQEAITNAAKHAEANCIEVAVFQDAERTVLTIADDGKGFEPGALGNGDERPGLGLLTMRERAECAGGELTLASSPGKGTRIEVVLPRRTRPGGGGEGAVGTRSAAPSRAHRSDPAAAARRRERAVESAPAARGGARAAEPQAAVTALRSRPTR